MDFKARHFRFPRRSGGPQSEGAGVPFLASGSAHWNTGANGASAGRTTTSGNNAYHYNANGSSAGRSQTVGNTTYHYDAQGRLTGTSRAP